MPRPEAARLRVVAFDLETTGTDPATDRIVELCVAPLDAPPFSARIDPGIPIPPGATAVHGIRDEDVEGCPTFRDVAPRVQALVDGATLLGYNSRSFDTPLLDAELRRAGERGIDLERVEEIDVYRVWQAVEPRTLAGAAKRWLGREHTGAHRARDDVRTTLAVYAKMRDAAGLTDEYAVRLTKPDHEIDRAGKFALDEVGRVCFTFGKHKGVPVNAVDPGYLEWMSKGEFPTSTKAVIPRLIEGNGDLPEAKAFRVARGIETS